MLRLAGIALISGFLKKCAGNHLFLQPGSGIDPPDWQSGFLQGPDPGVEFEVSRVGFYYDIQGGKTALFRVLAGIFTRICVLERFGKIFTGIFRNYFKFFLPEFFSFAGKFLGKFFIKLFSGQKFSGNFCPIFYLKRYDALRAKRLVGFCATHLPVLRRKTGSYPAANLVICSSGIGRWWGSLVEISFPCSLGGMGPLFY